MAPTFFQLSIWGPFWWSNSFKIYSNYFCLQSHRLWLAITATRNNYIHGPDVCLNTSLIKRLSSRLFWLRSGAASSQLTTQCGECCSAWFSSRSSTRVSSFSGEFRRQPPDEQGFLFCLFVFCLYCLYLFKKEKKTFFFFTEKADQLCGY